MRVVLQTKRTPPPVRAKLTQFAEVVMDLGACTLRALEEHHRKHKSGDNLSLGCLNIASGMAFRRWRR